MSDTNRALKASRRRDLTFSIVRGAAAILIALLVAALLIFVSSEGATPGEKFSQTMAAMRQLLIGPIFRTNGSVASCPTC